MDDNIRYTTEFYLEYPVNDFGAADLYLAADDMTEYLHGAESDTKDFVTNVEWILEDEESGYIIVDTNRELTDDESKRISEWIRGQCSDGLGEGFEQQDFAGPTDEEIEQGYEDGDDLIEECMSSFDWRTNKYLLIRRT